MDIGARPLVSSTHSASDKRSPPQQAAQAAAAGLRAFTRIAELWGLSIAEQQTLLGIASRSTYFKWKKDPHARLPRDTLERLSYLLGIYKALQLLLPQARAADE